MPSSELTSTASKDHHNVVVELPILNIIRHIGHEPNPKLALSSVLDICVAETDASSGRLYLLELGNSIYKCHKQTKGLGPAANLPVDILLNPAESPDPILGEVLTRKRSKVICPSRDGSKVPVLMESDRSRLIVPIVRKKTCLGLIDLGSDKPDRFGRENVTFVEAASTLALLLLEKEDTLKLLKELPTPIDFNLDWETFLDKLMLLISFASTMPRIILREWNSEEDVLTSLKAFGFADDTMRRMDLKPVAKYPQFAAAVLKGETQPVRSVDEPEAVWVREMPQLEGIRSFVVVPVKVGDHIFGTLSFAAHCDYDYSELEIAGFETIANAIGVSITNWRGARQANETLFDKARVSAMITSNEVAQSARHTITNFTAESHVKLYLIEKEVGGLPARQLDKVQRHIKELRENFNGINKLVNMIRESARVPDKVWTKVEISAIWREAFDMVSGRLANNDIKVSISPDRVQARVCREFLRQAFLQLIFNSIDALKDRNRSNRLIKVAIDDEGPNSNFIKIRYTDNGPGIDPSKLKLTALQGTREPKVIDIFLEGVTSKSDQGGSGFGLYEVREIIKDHPGSSIDLVDYHNGVTFDIRIAKEPKL